MEEQQDKVTYSFSMQVDSSTRSNAFASYSSFVKAEETPQEAMDRVTKFVEEHIEKQLDKFSE